MNIVLVHGAWGDGSHWRHVIPSLHAKGYQVSAVQTSVTSLADDIDRTSKLAAAQDGRGFSSVTTERTGSPHVYNLPCGSVPERFMSDVNVEYYRRFRILFERHALDLLPEFDEKVRTIHGLQVCHWLLSL
jgi:hypothetical protein